MYVCVCVCACACTCVCVCACVCVCVCVCVHVHVCVCVCMYVCVCVCVHMVVLKCLLTMLSGCGLVVGHHKMVNRLPLRHLIATYIVFESVSWCIITIIICTTSNVGQRFTYKTQETQSGIDTGSPQ